MSTWKWRNRVVAAALVCGSLSGLITPVSAGPVPPACDPTVSGPGVPGCPSVLLGEVGDIENPGYSLPDIVPDTTDVYIDYEWIELDPKTGQWVFGPGQLNFDTVAQNTGKVPVDIQADDPTAIAGSPVSQCVSWTTDLMCRRRQAVGGFTWHDDHKHYHFGEFGSYELRRLLADGSVDFSSAGLISTSPKVSVCLLDSRPIRDDARPVPRYNTCNPVEEGISPGWADVYATGIEGQMLSLDGLTDGRYALVISLNVEGRLFETNLTNNRVIAVVEITRLGGFFPEATIVQKSLG